MSPKFWLIVVLISITSYDRFFSLEGDTHPFLLSAKRDTQAAKRFLRKALNAVHNQEPRVINVDKNATYPKLDFIHSSGVNSNIWQTFKQRARNFYHLS